MNERPKPSGHPTLCNFIFVAAILSYTILFLYQERRVKIALFAVHAHSRVKYISARKNVMRNTRL